MKRRILGVLLMLLMVLSMGLTASAAKKETNIYDKNGVLVGCWVWGKNNEMPTTEVPGYTWVKASGEGATRISPCEKDGIDGHDCQKDHSFWEAASRMEYRWNLVENPILIIECRDTAGKAMEGSMFRLIKEDVLRDELTGEPLIHEVDGIKKVTWDDHPTGFSVLEDGVVDEGGSAVIRLKQEMQQYLDPSKEFHQLTLVQELTEEQREMYDSPKRYYVNFKYHGPGNYEIISIKLADKKYDSKDGTLAYDTWINSNYETLNGEDASEYDGKMSMSFKNSYVKGNLYLYINVEGFDPEVPDWAIPKITVIGPNGYYYPLTKSEITGQMPVGLEELRMGTYQVVCSDPVIKEGYTEKLPEMKIEHYQPTDSAEPTNKDKPDTVTLEKKGYVNAKYVITYTYYPDHIHIWDEGVLTDPTCTKDGYYTYTCKDPECGEFYTVPYGTAHGHDWDEGIVTKDRTCYEDGCKTYTCSYCGETKEEIIPKYDHNSDEIWEEVVTQATCKNDKFTTFTCIYCGLSYQEIEEYTQLEHDMVYTGEQKVSCDQDAKKFEACKLCGDEFETILETKLGHDYDFDSPTIVEATCTEAGHEVFTCSRCDKKLTGDPLPDKPATGHNYDSGKVTEPTCTEKGYTTYTCTVKDCGYSYPGNYTDALGHSYVSEVIKPTKDREGYTLHTCSVCGDSYTSDHKDKLPSKDNSGSSSSSSKDKSDKDKESDNKSGSSSGSSSKGQSSGKNNAANISGSASDTLVVKFFDENNQPLNSGMVALYDGNTQLKSWSCTYENVVVVDNLEKYAKDGEVVAYTLKQSKAMDGYEVSKDSLTVQLQKQGSNLKVNVKSSGNVFSWAAKGSSVETGRDGKPIVSFINKKETTKFEIACQVEVEFDGDCLQDNAMMKEYLQKEYKFTLNWTDEDGEEKSESLSLGNGGSGSWKAKLPFGTKYEITATDPDGKVLTGLSENASGTLNAKQMDENVKVVAAIKYEVELAAPKKLKMTVVDQENGTPLRGSNFELKSPDGEKIATYISRANGEFYIDDVFLTLGDYLMVQNKAAEGYATINGGIPVMVSLAYTPQSENNVQKIEQFKEVVFAHQDVSLEDDGSYTIENGLYDVVIGKTSGEGKNTGVILGIAGGVLALAAGGAATYVMVKKKRSKNSVEEQEEEV